MKLIFTIFIILLIINANKINSFGQELNKKQNKELDLKSSKHYEDIQANGDEIILRDDEDNSILIFTDEGVGASILLPSLSSISNSSSKLYNLGGNLYWSGSQLGNSGSSGGWTDNGATIRLTDLNDNVGIGIASPLSKLHITSTSSSYGMLRIENELHGANEATIGFKMGSDAVGTDTWVMGIGPWGIDSCFVIGRASPRIVVSHKGYLGIGRNYPQCNLDVNGNSIITANSSIHDLNPSALTVINSGTGYGISAEAAENFGIHGQCNANNGEGVRGTATNLTGFNYGGYFEASGNSGTGVYGKATNSGGVLNYGGYFESEGSGGVGVRGLGNGGAGVQGESVSGYGGIFGSGNDHLDLMLQGPIGRINSDPDYENADMIISANNDVIIRLDNDGGENGVFRVKTSTGTDVCKVSETGRLTTGELELTGGSDLSEKFNVNLKDDFPSPEPGMLVSIDPNNEGELRITDCAYDKKIAGIISGAGGVKTGLLMGQNGSVAGGNFPVALTGRVFCLANNSGGNIEPGDLLTSSQNPGYAMKVNDFSKAHGAIIGKAMSALDSDEGLVLVLVSLQ